MTAIFKNVYLDESDGFVNKYNNTYHRTIKIKSIDVKKAYMFPLMLKIMKKILKVKLVIM